ncbi:MAG: hypothetical protein R2788_01555 [Saprospiraceae bacterium]
MDNVASIGGHLSITETLAESIHGLGGLSSLGSYFSISSLPVLSDISALENLGSINGFISIHGADQLVSLTGLHNIDPNIISSIEFKIAIYYRCVGGGTSVISSKYPGVKQGS